MTDENRLINARADIRVATDAIRAAEALVGLGLLRDAMSRSYYAAFHAARALLLLQGYEPKTHASLFTLFHQHVVGAGLLEPRYNLLLARLQAYRNASDYAFEFAVPVEDVRTELDATRELVERARVAVGA